MRIETRIKATELIESYGRPEILDWGFRFLVDSELEALLIGYGYRNSPNGYLVEFAGGVNKYSVTVWNARAKELGFAIK